MEEKLLRANIGRDPNEKRSLLGAFRALLASLTTTGYGAAEGRWGADKVTTPVIDISEYVYDVDFAALKAAGIKGCICKCSQGSTYINPKFAGWCQAAYDADMPFMAYHVFVPGIVDNKAGNTSLQIANMRKALENKKIYGLWIDNEIYRDAGGKVIAPLWLEDWCHDLIDTSINEFGGRVTVIGMYTAMWFINSYAPNITNWVHKYPLWLAQYPYSTDSVTTTWEELAAKWYPPQDVKVVTPGLASWQMWQFSGDKFKLPGCYANAAKALTAVDLNMVAMKEVDWHKLIGFVPKEEPPVVPPDDDDDDDFEDEDDEVIDDALEDLAASIEALHTTVDQIYDLLDKHFK